MNETFKEKYIEDFNTALNIYENDYSHEDLINFLNNGSITKKQIAALKLDNINTDKDAEIFINNLTGCDGKIREAVSFRLKEFIPENPKLYIKFHSSFLDAIIDINGNICRNTLEAIKPLKKFKDFTDNFCPELVNKTLAIIPEIKAFDIQEGKYKINKQVFKLYWYLEAISDFYDFIDYSQLTEILKNTKDIADYTIREKTAKILSKTNINDELLRIKQELKNDANYYVRRF